MEKIFIGLIVLLAVLYLYRRISRSIKASGSGCCCGCDACGKLEPENRQFRMKTEN